MSHNQSRSLVEDSIPNFSLISNKFCMLGHSIRLAALFVLSASFAHAAASGLIPCGNTVSGGVVTDPCTYNDLVTLAQNVINFLIFKIAAPLGAVMFAYAGYTYITNGGNEGKITEAHTMFLAVFWGLVVALAAWLLVNFVLEFFLGSGSSFNFLAV